MELGSRRPFDSVAATCILLEFTLPDDTKRSISIVIDWETGGAIKINLAVHGWYPTPLHQADLGSRRPFDSVAATYRILPQVTLADVTKRRWELDRDRLGN